MAGTIDTRLSSQRAFTAAPEPGTVRLTSMDAFRTTVPDFVPTSRPSGPASISLGTYVRANAGDLGDAMSLGSDFEYKLVRDNAKLSAQWREALKAAGLPTDLRFTLRLYGRGDAMVGGERADEVKAMIAQNPDLMAATRQAQGQNALLAAKRVIDQTRTEESKPSLDRLRNDGRLRLRDRLNQIQYLSATAAFGGGSMSYGAADYAETQSRIRGATETQPDAGLMRRFGLRS